MQPEIEKGSTLGMIQSLSGLTRSKVKAVEVLLRKVTIGRGMPRTNCRFVWQSETDRILNTRSSRITRAGSRLGDHGPSDPLELPIVSVYEARVYQVLNAETLKVE
jgi:hypothetical protein